MPYTQHLCPSCRGSQTQAGGIVASNPRAEDCDFESLRQRWHGFYKDRSFFTYARCTCGMLYSPVYFSAEQLDRLYASMPANMAEVEPGSLEATQRRYFEELRGRYPLEGDLLEIGPDRGLFAQHCVSAGRFRKAWMFEPNEDAHAELRQRLSAVDTDVSTSLTDLSRVPDGSVSLMAMIHVLDHLIDPVAFLKQVLPKLREDAVLFVVTHNERSPLARLLRRRWPAYCLQHPHLFNPQSMRLLMERAGFTVTKTVRSTNHFPLPYLIGHLLLAANLERVQIPLPAVELPLKLGNFITLARVTGSKG